MKILGILRNRRYSPNSEARDEAILAAVARNLHQLGGDVSVMSEDDFIRGPVDQIPRCIVQMARTTPALERLARLEQQGYRVVNASRGVYQCRRAAMTRLFLAHGIPYPPSAIVATESSAKLSFPTLLPGWIKRADNHAIELTDVGYVSDLASLQNRLPELAARGVHEVVLSRHLHGDLVKFYGVVGSGFFHCLYPAEQAHSKFGLEVLNDALQHYPYSRESLHGVCERAAQILGIDIYGGDCIVAADGSFTLIDFNDWPSFSPCREQAAAAIASAVMSRFTGYSTDI